MAKATITMEVTVPDTDNEIEKTLLSDSLHKMIHMYMRCGAISAHTRAIIQEDKYKGDKALYEGVIATYERDVKRTEEMIGTFKVTFE